MKKYNQILIQLFILVVFIISCEKNDTIINNEQLNQKEEITRNDSINKDLIKNSVLNSIKSENDSIDLFEGNDIIELYEDTVEIPEATNFRIYHHKVPGIGIGAQPCMLVQENDEIGGDNWFYFYNEIEGFNYEWGYIYNLKIKTEKVENLPQDASSIRYILVNILSKIKVEEYISFEMKLKDINMDADPFVWLHIEEGYSFFNDINIDCSNLCVVLFEKLDSEDTLTGIFRHSKNNEILLQFLY